VVERIRVAVVGVGGIGAAHCFASSTLAEYELVAICDVDDRVRDDAATNFGVHAFADTEALYASGLIDAVILATPPSTHVPLVRDALNAGLHVYCEKPFVADAADGYALGHEADAAKRVVQVGFQYRFQPSYVRARALIDDGTVGPIFRANLVATNWFRPQSYFEAAPWRKHWRHGAGGVLMNQAIHQLDALLWFAGRPSQVFARATRARHDIEVEDDVSAMFEFPNGGRGTLVASTVDPIGWDRIEIHGERASLIMNDHNLRVGSFDGPAQHRSDHSDDHYERVSVTWDDVDVPPPSPGGYDYLLDTHRDFAHAIRDGTTPRNAPEAASCSVEVANAVYLSAILQQPVALPLAPDVYGPLYERLCRGDVALAQSKVAR
jgi:predicted dehydrogenase